MSKKPVLAVPALSEEWREKLRSSSMKIGFHLSLSTAMLEYLSAVADDVQWDRGLYWHSREVPENWIASQNSLTKRGLIRRKTDAEIEATMTSIPNSPRGEWCYCVLTPAGEVVVELLKLAGMFVEADAAINKKSRKKA